MSFKPSDIFIGVIDFFSVMLPGALLTYFLMGFYYADIFGEDKIFLAPPNEAAQWIIFFVASYITGNLIFMLAAFLDKTYDNFFRDRFFLSKYDLCYKTARSIREKHICTDVRLAELVGDERLCKEDYDEILKNKDREIFNTFKWAQHFLLFNKPEALANVQRIVADSKFFRSLVVSFLIIAVLMFIKIKILLGIIFVALAGFSYYRYGDFRLKATTTAYELIVTFFYLKPEESKVAEEKNKTESESSEKSKEPHIERVEEKTIRVADLKQTMSEDFTGIHQKVLSFLTKGISKPLKLITFDRAARENRLFTSDKDETWFCLQGRGVLNFVRGNKENTIFLMPNQIFSVEKETEISLSGGEESIEILVLEK